MPMPSTPHIIVLGPSHEAVNTEERRKLPTRHIPGPGQQGKPAQHSEVRQCLIERSTMPRLHGYQAAEDRHWFHVGYYRWQV